MVQYIFPHLTPGWDITTYLSVTPQSLRQPSPHLLAKNEYLIVPFGLAQAPAYFQELMNKVLKGLPFTITYLDGIIIYSETAENHLNQVFHKLQNEKLSMKLSKCHFFANEIQYLGHILNATGIKLLPSKMEAILDIWPCKECQTGVSFP